MSNTPMDPFNAEIKVGDIRKALKHVEAEVRGHVPSTVTEFILSILENTK